MLHPFKIHGKFRSIPWSLPLFFHGFRSVSATVSVWVSACFFPRRCLRGGSLAEWFWPRGSSRCSSVFPRHTSFAQGERERRARSTKSTCVNICKVDDRSRSVLRAQSCEAVKKGKLPFDDFNDCRWQFTSTAIFRSFWHRLPPSQNHFDLYSKL